PSRAEWRATQRDVSRGSLTARSPGRCAPWPPMARLVRSARWGDLDAEPRLAGPKDATAFPAPFRRWTAARLPALLRGHAVRFFRAPGRTLGRIGSLDTITYIWSCGPLHVRHTEEQMGNR